MPCRRTRQSVTGSAQPSALLPTPDGVPPTASLGRDRDVEKVVLLQAWPGPAPGCEATSAHAPGSPVGTSVLERRSPGSTMAAAVRVLVVEQLGPCPSEGRLPARRPRERHDHAHRPPARPSRHGSPGGRALRRTARGQIRVAKYHGGITRASGASPCERPGLLNCRNPGVRLCPRGRHTTYAHAPTDSA